VCILLAVFHFSSFLCVAVCLCLQPWVLPTGPVTVDSITAACTAAEAAAQADKQQQQQQQQQQHAKPSVQLDRAEEAAEGEYEDQGEDEYEDEDEFEDEHEFEDEYEEVDEAEEGEDEGAGRRDRSSSGPPPTADDLLAPEDLKEAKGWTVMDRWVTIRVKGWVLAPLVLCLPPPHCVCCGSGGGGESGDSIYH